MPRVSSPRSSRLREIFSIDPRSLALFRIAIALILLTDLAIRAADLHVMYTDDGMFPRAEIRRLYSSMWNWSFHFASGSWGLQAALFGIAAAFALALLAGFHTRMAVIGSWLLLISIHHRVPPILSGAEILLRMLLFWAMFLPLGRGWSLDRWLGKRRHRSAAGSHDARVVSMASAAILLQMAVMYLFSAIFKSNVQWTGGEALAGILAHDFYGSVAGAWLLQYPGFLNVLTRLTLVLEWAAPLLLFCPGSAALRLAAMGALTLMHAGIAIFLEVGLFPYVALAGLTLFLPPAFWNRLLLRHRSSSTRSVPDSANSGKAFPPLLHDPAQRVCLVLFACVVAINLNSLPGQPLKSLSPEKWTPLTRGLGFSQYWGVFDTVPSKDGWYVAWAKLRDGSEVDLLRKGARVTAERPPVPGRLYPNHYWQKLFREMAYEDDQGFQFFRAPAAQWLCRNWNSRNPPEKQVVEFELIYCMESRPEDPPSSSTGNSHETLLRLDAGLLPR